VADSPGTQQLGAAVRQALAEAAGYLALVTRNNPKGSADQLLRRPDTDAVLAGALDSSRQAAGDLVQQYWGDAGAAGSGDATLGHLLDDVDRIFGSLAHLRNLVRHAHASVPDRKFVKGVTPAGENPSQRAAEERADAVRDALLAWGRQAALRVRMTAHMAEGAGAAAAVLAAALRREAAGEKLAKRWRAHPDSPTCCLWCRRLHGVTIGLRESFVPHLGGPVPSSRTTERHVRSPAGEHRYGLPAGSPIIYTHPPHPYRGKLQGPLLHPFCRCRLEIVRAVDSSGMPPVRPEKSSVSSSGYLTADDIRKMPEDDYQADRAFLEAALLELDQVLKRLAEGGG
jgi:hypothetical protein